MRTMMRMSLAATVGALALGWAGLHGATAADMSVQGPYQGQYEAPPPAYGPPPVEEGYAYPPPPVGYGYPPPVAYYAYGPRVVFWPGPYYGPGPYWRGYGPRFAYGYGRFGRGFRR